MDTEEIGWEGVDWIHVGQNLNQWRAFANIIMSQNGDGI
jgi:hypothetical protein